MPPTARHLSPLRRLPLPRLLLVTPGLAQDNNGNWQTARRWARMLAPIAQVHLSDRWDGRDADLMVALHARRSAQAVHTWKAAPGRRPLLLVLTGTDLYRDIDRDADAQASLALADRLVVLNELGARRLPPALQARCRVVLQSCSARTPLAKTRLHLRVLMVGHLRDEKDPLTYLRAAERLALRPDVHFDHIGAALDPALGRAALDLAGRCPRYRWLGGLDHARTRGHIQRAHLLVHASRMEGGAHVVIEALRSGTPVLASRIDGNLGLLGETWPGCFDVGDDAALAALVAQARDDAAMLPTLQALAAARAPLFEPRHEANTLRRLVHPLLNPTE